MFLYTSIFHDTTYGFEETCRIMENLGNFVSHAHRLQTRRDGSSYFYSHILPVTDRAGFISSMVDMTADSRLLAMACALLHDTVEDAPEAFITDWKTATHYHRIKTLKEKLINFGFSKTHSKVISNIVINLLTKNKKFSYSEYVDKICLSKSKIAKIVKYADMSCNMADCFDELNVITANRAKTLKQLEKYSKHFGKVAAALKELKKVEA